MIYIRKLFKQDLRDGKQIAFPKEPSYDFFKFKYQNNEEDRQIYFTFETSDSNLVQFNNRKVETRLYSAGSESRIDGQLKAFIRDELKVEIGDLLVIKNNINDIENYKFSIVKKTDALYEMYLRIINGLNHTIFISDNSIGNKPSQIIYYGVPGCGKSNKIDEETGSIPDEQKMRVVFHPEYTNADFVGQILPTNIDGNIEYKFRPGPLSKILRRAYLHPDKKYYLIVEEINRGNAAAIFGEYFQLLDRIATNKEVTVNGYTYTEGWSRYSIENEFINWYIRENLYAEVNYKLQNEDDGIAKKSDDESQKSMEIGNLHFSANTGIRLPPNLSILATMNTSDQNVFILDNAFQRRWDMVLVKNEFGGDSEKAKTEEEQKNIYQQKTALIEGSKITWETFHKTINEKISQFSKENNFSSMIDKRLGCWFVKAIPNENDETGKYIITKKSFKHKILKYLWDDAFKFSREDVFEDADNFESLLEKVKMDEPNFGIFKNVDFSAEKSEKSEEENEL